MVKEALTFSHAGVRATQRGLLRLASGIVTLLLAYCTYLKSNHTMGKLN